MADDQVAVAPQVLKHDDNRFLVNVGPRDDHVSVRIEKDPNHTDYGRTVVESGGNKHTFAAGDEVMIRTGKGDDKVELQGDAALRVTVLDYNKNGWYDINPAGLP